MKNTFEIQSVCAPILDSWGVDFADNWLKAWNSKNIDKIAEFYSDEVIIFSPTVRQVTGYQNGIAVKKSDIKEMWSKVFQQIPEIHYTLVAVAVGIDSLTIHYTSCQCDMVADVLKFDSGWKIIKSHTYY